MPKYKLRECIAPECSNEEHMPAGLCFQCKKKLRDYDSMKGLADSVASENKERFGIRNTFPLPHTRGLDLRSNTTDGFRRSLEHMINSLSPLVDGGEARLISLRSSNDGPSSGYGNRPNRFVYANSDFMESYDLFISRLADVLRESYADGQRHGQSLLRQLNNGEISTDTFEERKDRGA